MSYVNFNRALTRAQIEALGTSGHDAATNGKIYFATDGGIYVGNSNGTADMKADLDHTFVAEYSETIYTNVKTAWAAGKTIVCHYFNEDYNILGEIGELNIYIPLTSSEPVTSGNTNPTFTFQTVQHLYDLNATIDSTDSTDDGSGDFVITVTISNQGPAAANGWDSTIEGLGCLTSQIIGDAEDPTNSWYTKTQTDALVAGKQDTLVSGTNIKTIGGQSILGPGNIEVGGTFYATYGTTTYAQVLAAYNAGKTVFVRRGGEEVYTLNYYDSSNFFFSRCAGDENKVQTVSLDSGGWDDNGTVAIDNIYWVNYNTDDDSADRTFFEIYQAYKTGKCVLLREHTGSQIDWQNVYHGVYMLQHVQYYIDPNVEEYGSLYFCRCMGNNVDRLICDYSNYYDGDPELYWERDEYVLAQTNQLAWNYYDTARAALRNSGSYVYGNYSVAEGQNTKTRGSYSHSEGYNTIAMGMGSHAEGRGVVSTVSGVSGAANATTYTTSSLHGLRVGDVICRISNPTSHGACSIVTDVPSNTSFVVNQTLYSSALSNASIYKFVGIAHGNYSHAEGYHTTASGSYSHAEGRETIASDYSHAEGNQSKSSGTGSHSEGYITTASGDYSHSEGYNTNASGNYSHAEGSSSNAYANMSHAEGASTTHGIYSHAEGVSTAQGSYSHAEGYNTNASGSASHAEGKASSSISSYTISGSAGATTFTTSAAHNLVAGNIIKYEGECRKVESVPSSTSFSLDAPLSSDSLSGVKISVLSGASYGENSHTEGNCTFALNDNDHAEGYQTVSSGHSSHAEGYMGKAVGQGSHAEGGYQYYDDYYDEDVDIPGGMAIGVSSHAEGSYTSAYGRYSHAEGRGNWPPSTPGTTSTANNSSHITSIDGTTYGTNGVHNIKVGYIVSMPGSYNYRRVVSTTNQSFTLDAALGPVPTTGTTTGTLVEFHQGVAYGPSSHVEGAYNIATNFAEHAQGQYNKSNYTSGSFGNAGNTIHSVGIGTGHAYRKNAVEIMQNGDTYLYGVGGYDGTNPSSANTLQESINSSMPCESVTYAALKTLKDGGSLIPGKQYRITDYVATTAQTGTWTANHPFDIIVTADSPTTLNETARAALHSGDAYFANCDLNAWQLKYSFDNDTDRFVWADPAYPAVTSVDAILFHHKSDGDYILARYSSADRTGTINGQSVNLYGWRKVSGSNGKYFDDQSLDYTSLENPTLHTTSATPSPGDVAYGFIMQNYISQGTVACYSKTGTTGGKGVVYWMKDEWNNEAPYDFKGIFIELNSSWLNSHSDWAEDNLGITTISSSALCYWLNWVDNNDDTYDLSIIGNSLLDDESCYRGVYNNVMKKASVKYIDEFERQYYKQIIPCNIISSTEKEDGCFYGCINNYFDVDCAFNILGAGCSDNRFERGSCNNLLYANCYSNKFAIGCFDNTLYIGSYNNTFGQESYSNILGNESSYNKLGMWCQENVFHEECSNNKLDNRCSQNTFGDGCCCNYLMSLCEENSFGDYCNDNLFGSGCYGNEFEDSCTNNSFGSECNNNIFGQECCSNSFGDKCNSNEFYAYSSWNSFGEGCSSNTLDGYNRRNSLGNDCSHNEIGNSNDGNSFGNECGYNEISGDYCCYNTFGNGCKYIKFGTSSTAKSYCSYNIIESGNQHIYINATGTTSSNSHYQNVKICQGVNNTSTWKTITDSNVGQTYQTVYQPASSQTINV